MGDKLAEQLYVAWRAALADPTEVLAWGNLDADSRRAWEAAATVARKEMAGRFVASMRDVCQGQLDAATAVVNAAGQVLKGLEGWVR